MKHTLLTRKSFVFILLSLFFIITSCSQDQSKSLSVTNLRCEYRVDPMGIDRQHPRLSWVMKSADQEQQQSAWQILVASTSGKLARNKGDLWNSGKVNSGQSNQVVYAGLPLNSRKQVWWKVKIWNQGGKTSGWSDAATWSMGLLNPQDWKANWISDPVIANSNKNVILRNGYHSALYKNAEHSIVLTIDLGKIAEFDTLCLYPARPHDYKDTPGFLFPVRFKAECSDGPGFSGARTLIDLTKNDIPNPGDVPQKYGVGSQKARYIRVTMPRLSFRDEGNWGVALNEIEALGGGENLALHAGVQTRDAIISADWDPSFLTDGYTKTLKSQEGLPAIYARKDFHLDKKIRKATAYVSARGLYEFYLNGKRAGDQLLAPEWTTYEKRIPYQTFDVTALLNEGDNAASAILGEGWFAGDLMVYGRFAYGRYPSFLAQMEIELSDGTVQTVVSDGSWKTTAVGPITSTSIYHGEWYDARLENKGWEKAGFNDAAWNGAQTDPLDSVQLVWLRNEPIRIERELPPLTLDEPLPGVYVLDFGQNMVGWCHLSGMGKSGQLIRIRHGEALCADSTLYTENLRGALQIDRYIPAEDGSFTFEPRFTYHGFRYMEITGLAKAPVLDSVIGEVFHSSSPFTGRFECSDPYLNRLMENIQWTQRANLMSSPNDCPQRNERFGWMGDIQAFAQTGSFNMDLAAFFSKFLQDTRDDQADDGRFPDFAPHPGDQNKEFSGVPAWGDAGVFVPWTAYVNYADTQLLRDQYDAAVRWVEYIHRNNPDLIWRVGRNNDYNDWLSGDWIILEGWPRKGGEVAHEIFATAFFAQSTRLVSRMAEVIGKPEDANHYRTLVEEIKKTFNQAFVSPDGRITGNTQGGYALALSFDLLPAELRPNAAAYLADNIRNNYKGHLSTGIQTSHRAMMELSKAGYHDLAWELLVKHEFPSWLYMVDNGATTIWERWDGMVKERGFQNPGMNSLNHWALGSVGEWMWRYIIGLNPDEQHPGWKHFIIAPMPGGGVTWANGSYESIQGTVKSAWKIEGGKFMLDVTVPANTTATIRLPFQGGETEVGSGTHHFTTNVN
ncbi:MAG: glycoside hydrolase family 78 protein [Bacteroidota bacterium]